MKTKMLLLISLAVLGLAFASNEKSCIRNNKFKIKLFFSLEQRRNGLKYWS
jgi:hypothetical protein